MIVDGTKVVYHGKEDEGDVVITPFSKLTAGGAVTLRTVSTGVKEGVVNDEDVLRRFLRQVSEITDSILDGAK